MIIVIVGPTCTKKTLAAIEVALKMDGEIINADAFQCYKQLNIGVAKPTPEEMKLVPHHLFSFCNVNTKFSIADYQKLARRKIEEIKSRGKNVILVGGSGLYIRSLLYDYEFINNENAIDNEDKYSKYNNEELHNLLLDVDPIEAKKIHPNNRKRVIRALTIYEQFNKTKSEIIAEQKHNLIYSDVYIVSPLTNREELYNRINSRVNSMIENGLVDEVKNLYDKYDSNLQSLQAIGYKEFGDYFLCKKTLNETIEIIQKNTRNYAKRQITFVKHQFNNVFYYKDIDDLLMYLGGISKC